MNRSFENNSFRKLQYTASDKNINIKVQDVLRDILNLSAKEISRCKQFEDGMCVDGHKIRTNEFILPGQTLTVKLYEDNENASEIIPVFGSIDIVYEDTDLIVLNKPAGIVVHPSYAHPSDSLSNLLSGYYKTTGQTHVIRPIGRLDRETSGLIIFAKNRHSAAILSSQSENMSRHKEYLAICSGIFFKETETIDAPIKRVPNERMLRQVADDGKNAITHFHVEKQLADCALIRLSLDTGRTHQIRVHMSYIGHPLLGDSLYGNHGSDSHGLNRAALHASHLEFIHPITKKELCLDSQLPSDMKNILLSYNFLD